MTKKKQWEAHPWSDWRKRLLTRKNSALCLFRGKDYSCTTRAMIVQSYAFFAKTNLKISIKDLSTDPKIDGIAITLVRIQFSKTPRKKSK